MRDFISKNGWELGLASFLALLLVVTKIIEPQFCISWLDDCVLMDEN